MACTCAAAFVMRNVPIGVREKFPRGKPADARD
jgi:cytochrome c